MPSIAKIPIGAWSKWYRFGTRDRIRYIKNMEQNVNFDSDQPIMQNLKQIQISFNRSHFAQFLFCWYSANLEFIHKLLVWFIPKVPLRRNTTFYIVKFTKPLRAKLIPHLSLSRSTTIRCRETRCRKSRFSTARLTSYGHESGQRCCCRPWRTH